MGEFAYLLFHFGSLHVTAPFFVALLSLSKEAMGTRHVILFLTVASRQLARQPVMREG